jgi:UDP-N-acetylmuramoyl-tripeptide--D-alanyl-D-alanine ligase
MTLSQINNVVAGQQLGVDVRFSGVSTDTRTLQANDLYVALVGENFDGNDYVKQAFDKGACGAVVSRDTGIDQSQLRVKDTTIALGEIARLNRLASKARVVAITGSQGKTTVKEMIAAILRVENRVLVTKGNFNNHIGVPLTLLELDAEHDCAVIELGASGLGEIAYTVRMVLPHVAVLTNAAATHIEGFGDLDGVVRTKGEIIDGLQDGGVAVLNADDPHFAVWVARAATKRMVSFAVDAVADYRVDELQLDALGASRFILRSPVGDANVTLALAGKHNVRNAMAAAAASIEAGASLVAVVQGLAQVRPVAGRLSQMSGSDGAIVIDDSYNASPASFRAAIDVLASSTGNRVLIAGDMGELGTQSEQAHIELGLYAKQSGIDALWTTGAYSALSAESFGAGARHFATQDALIRHAKEHLHTGDVALVKGSRSATMDRVVEQIKKGDSA